MSNEPVIEKHNIGCAAGTLGALGILVVGGIIAGVLMATAPKPDEKKEPPRPVSVEVASVEERNLRVQVSVQGPVRARNESTLAAQVGGRIVWMSPSFSEGGAFKQGDPLVRIETADYELAVVRARAQVATAQQNLTREEAEAELARRDWAELGQGEASPLTLREPQMQQARAELAAARAQLQDAELQLSRTTVRAPYTGRVMSRAVSVGDYVNPSGALAEIFATDVVEVRVPLTNADLALLQTPLGYRAANEKAGPRATITGAVGGQSGSWQGRLVSTDAAYDERTRLIYGLVEVRNPFATPASPLAPGLFVSVRLEAPSAETLFAAPRGALKKNSEVYVVKPDNTLEVRRVQAAQTDGETVFFRSGLRAGERVVVSPLPSARAGMAVSPLQRPKAAAAKPKN